MSATEKSVAIFGTGNLGSAVAVGIARSKTASKLYLVNRTVEKAETLAGRLPNTEAVTLSTAVAQADILLLVVKPHAISALCAELQEAISETKKTPLIVSLAASPCLQELKALFSPQVAVARAMPSIGVAVGAGVTASYAEETEERATISALFSGSGLVLDVSSEAQLLAVLGVAASGLGFMALVAESLADGALTMGLGREEAMKCATQTVLAAGMLLDNSGMHPVELKARVASPGGTTAAGLHELEKAGVRGTFISAVEAAVKKAQGRS